MEVKVLDTNKEYMSVAIRSVICMEKTTLLFFVKRYLYDFLIEY